MTVTGLSETAQATLLLEMQEAADLCDVKGLEGKLSAAMAEGVGEKNDIYVAAREAFAKLESKEGCVELLAEKTREIKDSRASDTRLLHTVQNVISQARRLEVQGEELDAALEAMQHATRDRARRTIGGKKIEDICAQEIELVDRAFSDLSTFKNLRPASVWRGHQARRFGFMRGKAKQDMMLSHSRVDIKSSLTKLSFLQDAKACDMFVDILCWMGDRPVPEVQRAVMANAIVEVALSDPALADEAFVQVMKQLTHNPSRRSAGRGWELMLMMCQKIAPSNELYEYLRAFLFISLRAAEEEMQDMVRQCLTEVNTLPSADEDDGLMSVTVMLIDFSMRKVRTPAKSSLRHMTDLISEQLRLSRPHDFAPFMVADIANTAAPHRLLPDHAAISVIQDKMTALKERTGKSSSLMFKRTMLARDEALQPGDATHAKLTYLQAKLEYLHYPVVEELQLFYRIAAAIMWVDRDYYDPFVEKGGLVQDGVLEQLLPAVVLKGRRRGGEAKDILDCYAELSGNCDRDESKVVGMSRAFCDMQKLRLFGCYVWSASEREGLPANYDKAVDEPAARKVALNPKAAESPYIMGIGLRGIVFIGLSASGEGVCSKEFEFNDKAYDSIRKWGASRDYVQFVVSCVDPQRPDAGSSEGTITLQCPAAVDVAYACHRIHNMLQAERY